ncbi:MAG: dienelactone hydrolase family protein [Myxococcales bacterium]|nr:dienelactone hydrolase family protein [Myxococcales bacterium]
MHSQDVEFGYLVYPDSGTHPGVVMIHDVWGLTDHARDLANRLCDEGFAVLAMNLYRSFSDVTIKNPGEWMRSLSDPDLIADIQSGVGFVGAHPACVGHDVGVIGFCMGGMYALLAACAPSGLAASVAFYGLLSHEHGILHGESGPDPELKPRQPLDATSDLSCPLLCFFGDQDQFVPMTDIDALRANLRRAPKPAELVVYEGAGHAFMNDTRPDAFRPEIAEQAWKRMVAFFREHVS